MIDMLDAKVAQQSGSSHAPRAHGSMLTESGSTRVPVSYFLKGQIHS